MLPCCSPEAQLFEVCTHFVQSDLCLDAQLVEFAVNPCNG